MTFTEMKRVSLSVESASHHVIKNVCPPTSSASQITWPTHPCYVGWAPYTTNLDITPIDPVFPTIFPFFSF